jgi:hypothetical protein
MSQIIIPVDPFDYVVFGGTGTLPSASFCRRCITGRWQAS